MSAFRRALALELRHLRHNRWEQIGLFIVPGILLALIAAMLWQGPMRQLPLALVDSDGTTASRSMIRALEASPQIRINGSFSSEVEAVDAVRRGDAMAFVHLPVGLGAGLARHRKPVVRILYNASFLSAGGQTSRAAAEAMQSAVPDMAADQLPNHSIPEPRIQRLVVEATAIGNAASSFEWYLGLLIYPSVLHLVTACVTAMALGRELQGRSLARWTQASGAIAPALAGKMLPYVATVSLWGIAWILWLTLARGWRIEGSITCIVLAQTLFYAATAAITALLIALTHETATALSASAVYAGSALAYSGATLPLNGANAFSLVWSNVLPLPHYIAVQMGQVSGQTLTAAIAPMSALAAYVIVAGGGAIALIAAGARRA